MKNRHFLTDISILLIPAVLVGLLIIALRDFRLDDAFITYRVARNISNGVGFVYNTGHNVLSVTNPLYTLLLAAVHFLTPHLPVAGLVVGGIGIAATSVLLATLMRPAGRLSALSAGLFSAGFPLLYLTLGLETSLQIALGLLGVYWILRERLIAAAIILSLAALVRPDMVLLAGILAIEYVTRHWQQREKIRVPVWPLLAYGVPLLVWAMYGWLTFGTPLPATLGAKGAQAALGVTGFGSDIAFLEALGLMGQALLVLSWAWASVGLIVLFGGGWLVVWHFQPEDDQSAASSMRAARILLAWTILHLVSYIILGIVPYRWYFAPLIPALATLFALGTSWLTRLPSPRWRLAVAAALLVLLGLSEGRSMALINATSQRGEQFLGPEARAMLPVIDWDIYYEAGTWLNENTSPSDSVGVAEIGQPGYWAQRPMVDYLGLLQPDIAHALARGDIFWWLPHYMPDWLLLSQTEDRAALFGYILEDDPWYQATYEEITRFTDNRYTRSPLVVYRRLYESPEMMPDTMISPTNLPLTGISSDISLNDLSAGSPLRIRLRWQLSSPVDEPQHIVLRIATPDQSIVATQHHRVFAVESWPVDEPLTTYHPVVLADDLSPGVYHVQVGVGPSVDDVQWETVIRAKVPLPALTDFPENNHIQMGPVNLIGWQIAREDTALEVKLAWEAVETPSHDYTVFVHVTDNLGDIVAQTDRQPYFGTYPTGIWDPGERVADVLEVNLENVPPGSYEIHVGMYIPGQPALMTAEGASSVMVGELEIP